MTVNPLVAGRVDGDTKLWTGIWIAEDIDLIVQGVRSNNWVDTSLGAIGATLDGLALVSDPASTLLQYGFSWLIEQVEPLREALDWLAGDAAQIAAHAQTWRNVARSLHTSTTDLSHYVDADVAGWGGTAGPAYRSWSAAQRDAITALAKAAEAMATITEAAGFVVGAVRALVRDAIATVVSHLIVYATEEAGSLGFATPVVLEQSTTLVAAWSARIARWLHGLITSLNNLVPAAHRLHELIARIEEILVRRSPVANETERGSHPSGPPHGPTEQPLIPSELTPPSFADPMIDPQKIAGYVMNPNHPVGRNKYRVINSVTGLGVDDVAKVEEQIREGVRIGTPILGKLDAHGQRWAVDVPLRGPRGEVTVRTAWILDPGSSTPRLVTVSFP